MKGKFRSYWAHSLSRTKCLHFIKMPLSLIGVIPFAQSSFTLKNLKGLDHRPVVGTLTGNKDFLESFKGMQDYDIFEHVEMTGPFKDVKKQKSGRGLVWTASFKSLS